MHGRTVDDDPDNEGKDVSETSEVGNTIPAANNKPVPHELRQTGQVGDEAQQVQVSTHRRVDRIHVGDRVVVHGIEGEVVYRRLGASTPIVLVYYGTTDGKRIEKWEKYHAVHRIEKRDGNPGTEA